MNNENRLWFIYRRAWTSGEVEDRHRPFFSKTPSARHLFDGRRESDGTLWQYAEGEDQGAIYELMEDDERRQFSAGMEFLEAARKGDAAKIREFTTTGFNVNFRHPVSGMTALHLIASGGSKRLLRSLLEDGEPDFLVQDDQDRLPSVVAVAFNSDPAIARYLSYREKKQAQSDGVDYPSVKWGSPPEFLN